MHHKVLFVYKTSENMKQSFTVVNRTKQQSDIMVEASYWEFLDKTKIEGTKVEQMV